MHAFIPEIGQQSQVTHVWMHWLASCVDYLLCYVEDAYCHSVQGLLSSMLILRT